MKIKNTNLYIVILLISVKLYMFYATIYMSFECLAYSFIYTGSIMALMGWTLYNLKVNRWVYIILDSLVSVLMVFDLLYFNYFNQLPSIQSMNQIQYLVGMGHSIWLQFRLWMLYLVIEPILLIFIYKGNGQQDDRSTSFGPIVLANMMVLFLLLCPILISSPINTLIDNELLTYHIKDFIPKKEVNYNQLHSKVLDHNIPQSDLQQPDFIAHGGGEINGISVSNSKEALNESVRRGFSFIEVDLVWSTDQVPVLLHGWDGFVTRLFHVKERVNSEQHAYSHEEFMALQMVNGLHQMDLKGLMNWMGENHDIHIVTDIKEDNLKMLELIVDEYEQYQHRIIPQIYSIDEYLQVYYMGYEHIILTLYKSEYTEEQLKDFVTRYDFFAITMPMERVEEGLAKALKKEGVFIYCHTINEEELVVELRENGVEGFYSDVLNK